MRFHVDAWSPTYGASREAEGGPGESSSAKLDTDIELDAKRWRAMDPPSAVAAPRRVLLVDGVRRTDARIWIGEHPGLACSYAAGVVECTPGAAKLADAKVQRTIFTSADEVSDVGSTPALYRTESIIGADESDLANAVQRSLIELEITVSAAARADDDLLIVDGPLRSRDALPRTLGYVKTQQKQYLPDALSRVATSLRPGQRTPIFRIAGVYERLTWYLRLPGGGGSPWAGMVRVECSTELPEHVAIGLADLSAVTIPRFASVSYKDPRAPQNLVPIAGLEKRLRQLLGDPKLLHRGLVRASQR
ncbi:hypothetical protein [Allorhizocola rhizosphaerae]|uniref:hypothetical protein n=1 Tax=Allorhizocola rhizosphaerae TaxID=1872709 RepID=UPI000E3BC906|nr:hypothetical protein [Allorhizocola rhizosphaerae]